MLGFALQYDNDEINELAAWFFAALINKIIDGNGELVKDWNNSLRNAIHEIEDYENGIEAVILRKRKYDDRKCPVVILFIRDVVEGLRTLFKRRIKK